MKHILLIALIASVLLPASLMPAAAKTYTYPDLVSRMTDLEQLAVLPPTGETTGLASSYDRTSRYDAATGKYIDWAANADGSGIVRREGDSAVMADIAGPGCIWRIWSATASAGHVKIYLDGSTIPTVDLPFNRYFDRSAAPFTRANLVYASANGQNNYTPIPFQKSCKIVADPGWGNYYHFNYTRFPAGTVVPTFQSALPPADSAALDRADRILGDAGSDPMPPRPGQKQQITSVEALPGRTTTAMSLHGPLAITALKIRLHLPADAVAQRRMLRALTVQITWDGQSKPAVWSPLGDLFGTFGVASPHAALPTGIANDGTFYAYWYMPFAKSARIEVGNDGADPVRLTWAVTCAPLDRPISTLAYFHAKWHRDPSIPVRQDRWPDWPLLATQGRGRYVGTQLVVNQSDGGWWGEGDEKFFVDGETFPSTYGTGSEDYFGAAWGLGDLFARPYHGNTHGMSKMQPSDASVYRYHISDSIPFQHAFDGSIEKYLPATQTNYAAVVYWYLSPNGTDPFGPRPMAERADDWIPVAGIGDAAATPPILNNVQNAAVDPASNLVPQATAASDWAFNAKDPATDTSAIEPDGSLRVQVGKSDGVDWHYQLGRTNIPLREGRIYVLTFRAKADTARTISLWMQCDGKDWHGLGLSTEVPLTTHWRASRFIFVAQNVTDKSQIVFNIGQQNGVVWLGNLALTRETDTSPPPTYFSSFKIDRSRAAGKSRPAAAAGESR